MENYLYDTVEYRGFNINIHYDNDAQDPREAFDGLGKMVCFHSHYNLGDKHSFRSASEALFEILWHELDCYTETMDIDYQEMMDQEFIEKYWPKFEKNAIVLPLYLYEHSGITMNTSGFSCPWDSGQVGFIYLSKKDARKEYGRLTKKNIQRIVNYLKGEVQEYDYFLTGQVYGYTIKPTDSNKEIECDDSCFGFYGDIEYMVSEAKESIKHCIRSYRDMVVKAFKERKEYNWTIYMQSFC